MDQIYCTVGNQEKIDFLTTQLDIPRDHIFNSRDSCFLSEVMKATKDRGVDVVLNSLSGDLLHASWKCVAEFGTFIELGRRDMIGQGKLAMNQFESNRTFVGVDLSHLWNQRPQVVEGILERAIEFWKQGYIRPRIAATHSAAHISEPFRQMTRSQHIGKLVVDMPEDPVHELPAEAVYETLRLRDDRAYLFVGGLGSLGRAIATWLVERGAKELVFLSRSAGFLPEHKLFVEELAAMGCTATLVSGDVVKLDNVIQAMRAASKPIGGVFQAAMVLRVSLVVPSLRDNDRHYEENNSH